MIQAQIKRSKVKKNGANAFKKVKPISEARAKRILNFVMSADPVKRKEGMKMIKESTAIKVLAMKSRYDDVREEALSKVEFVQDLVDIAIESDYEDSALWALGRLGEVNKNELIFDYRDIALLSRFKRARIYAIDMLNIIMHEARNDKVIVNKVRESLKYIMKNTKYKDSFAQSAKYLYGYDNVLKMAINATDGYVKELLAVLAEKPDLLREAMNLTNDKNVRSLARDMYMEISEHDEKLAKVMMTLLK